MRQDSPFSSFSTSNRNASFTNIITNSENTLSISNSLVINVTNICVKREASIVVDEDSNITKNSTLYEAIYSVRDRGILSKVDKEKEFIVNVMIQYDNNKVKKIKYSPTAARSLHLKTLFQIPNIQNNHDGIIEIELDEIDKVTSYSDDNL